MSRSFAGGAAAFAFAALPFSASKVMAAVEGPCTACDDDLTDIDILNYALTLEHLENAFYRDGLARFSQADFTSTRYLREFGVLILRKIYPNFQLIAAHEQTHVNTLTAAVTSLGGTPVSELCYDFGYHNVEEFVKVAALLENTGVMAYDGAVHLICNPDLQTAGATIATVEARHASYLNLLTRAVPFPAAFDTPKTMAEILAAAGGFIVPCV
ncbi:MAG: ferritin-like domain-containing protein [Bryobacteraceae bacterium]